MNNKKTCQKFNAAVNVE